MPSPHEATAAPPPSDPPRHDEAAAPPSTTRSGGDSVTPVVSGARGGSERGPWRRGSGRPSTSPMRRLFCSRLGSDASSPPPHGGERCGYGDEIPPPMVAALFPTPSRSWRCLIFSSSWRRTAR
ncbi:hypothetical protein PR202_gb07297 [Eleusine coracana subsp. coracana]|uniref:Uncharacterized protein n=1 Tax=Eleusine coracana subsp. coracana TaxID=191504 RepID=A0AAV5EBR8_ELECO|nr:hypothetical protein PR202_gb07297 [Eleusine coracana subsp. coracana]